MTTEDLVGKGMEYDSTPGGNNNVGEPQWWELS
jgi:hypothetical protein